MEASPNPFAAPETDVRVAPEAPENPLPVAEPGKRLLGHMLDGFLAMILPILSIGFKSPDNSDFALLFYGSFLPLAATQAVLITTRGQSIGKIACKTKIVDMNQALPGFLRGVVLRSWLCTLLDFIPIFSLIDALFIVRDDRRTIHDLISGTMVVDVSVQWYEQ